MAGDAYTSIQTGGTGGIAEELVQDLWDKAIGIALREIPTARQFVDKRPTSPMAKGSSITLEKFEYLSAATVTAAKTPLTEESDVDAVAAPKPTPVTVTPNEYGLAIVRTKKLDNRTFAPVDEYLAHIVATHMSEVVDALVQDVMVAGSNVAYGGDAAAAGDIVNADVLTASLVRKTVTRLRTNKAIPWYGSYYAALIHPHTELDLREETGAGSWRTPNEYGMSQDRIWKGEVGEFEGCRWVVNAMVRTAANGAASATTYQNYFLGRAALAQHVLEEPHAVITPPTDKLGRFHGVGWYGDLGFARYEEKALYRVVTGSSLGDDL